MGFRIELRAKSDFKSNACGKLRQTIYFFWPNLIFYLKIDILDLSDPETTPLVGLLTHFPQDPMHIGFLNPEINNLEAALNSCQKVIGKEVFLNSTTHCSAAVLNCCY